ncbi:MAG: bacillithiol biosynthesis cysteine-adding enzyme BshC [Candidatus Sulfotelmatobacter sp.]
MKAQCFPFSQIPHTSRLFIDFLSYSPGVRSFYPQSPHFSEWMKGQASGLQHDPVRRERVSAILQRQNVSWDASPQTLSNIERLRHGAAAVVTGQQVGLLGGPMFSIYKALSSVKLAEEATAEGIDTVPIFWLATYDHDLDEVNHVGVPGSDGNLRTLSTSSHSVPNAPVSEVRFGEEIITVVEDAASLLGDSEVSQFLRECYRPGESLGTAFARLFARLFAKWGVIVLDASDPEFHRVAAPIYRAAIERAEDLNAALLARGDELEKSGYEQQVKVTPSSVLLFTMRQGARTPIHRQTNGSSNENSENGEFVIGSEAKKISARQLLDEIEEHPENFSPNVLLRPVVQDYLLPTLAYAGGAAEAAYFAQAGAVYGKLLGRVTPIIPRFSATIVEPKIQHKLQHYGLTAPEVFEGAEVLRRRLASHALPGDLQSAFERAGRSIADSFSALKEPLAKLDPTLVDASQTGASKVQYQLERLRERAMAAELRRSEVIGRHAEVLSNMLYPNGVLQEREIAGVYFLARHGSELLQSVYDAIHTDCHDHQILEL